MDVAAVFFAENTGVEDDGALSVGRVLSGHLIRPADPTGVVFECVVLLRYLDDQPHDLALTITRPSGATEQIAVPVHVPIPSLNGFGVVLLPAESLTAEIGVVRVDVAIEGGEPGWTSIDVV